MPEGVVDRLEMINVDQRNSQGGMGTNRTRNLRRRLALPGARVEQAGLGVDAGGVDELDMPERALEQRHERKGQEESQGSNCYTKSDQDGYTEFSDVIMNTLTRQVKLADADGWIRTSDGRNHQAGVDAPLRHRGRHRCADPQGGTRPRVTGRAEPLAGDAVEHHGGAGVGQPDDCNGEYPP